MKIVLKRDWDIPISPPVIVDNLSVQCEGKKQEAYGSTAYPIKNDEINGHYGGRRDELNMLINELLRRPKGSILISGYRGVGKTSFVYKALSELSEKDGNAIIVMLNAAQLVVWPENNKSESKIIYEIDPKKILENLIRRLYSTSKDSTLDPKIKERIDLLYKRAVAAEVNITERLQSQKNLRQTKMIKRELNFKVNDQKLILIFAGTLAWTLQYMSITSMEWLNKLIPIALALFGPLFLYNYQNIDQEDESISKNADETYMLDNCIGNLEFDLEKIHKDLFYIYNKKIIYVIDELDKLESDNNKSKRVDEILNYFKNFFTLSNAVFIFIGSEELYDSYNTSTGKVVLNKDINTYRTKNYTYFTTKYFISRPSWSDLNSYFKEIIEETDMDEEQLDIFISALCFEAKNDFFDLKKFINGRISNFNESNNPIIELINLDDDICKSRFHRAITLLYDEKYKSKYTTKWRENEQLIRELYNHAYNIFETGVVEPFEDPKDDTTESQMIRNFNGFLESLGALHVERETKQNIRKLSVSIRTYRYSGDIPTEPPLHLSEATEFERRYLYNFELLLKYARAIIYGFKTAMGLEKSQILPLIDDPTKLIDEFGRLNYNIQRIYDHGLNIYTEIIDKGEIYPYRREDIEKKTKDIENQTNSMLINLPGILSKMVIQLNPKVPIQQRKIEKKNDIFNVIPEEYRDHFLEGKVLVHNNESIKSYKISRI